MGLTKEQLAVVRAGEPLRVSQDGTDLVVMRADLFERVRRGRYDDDAWSDEEMDRLAAEDADALGWEGMEAYQDLDK